MNQHLNKQAYVFVVCGAKEYIKTLNFSIKALKKHTDYPIFVVTDSKRNEDTIQHNQIIDIETPIEYSNHVASIWLKTSLHKILPKNHQYCYLDSDVIALNSECNKIFEHYKPPVTFAKDTYLKYFSPYALQCGCYDNFISDKKKVNSILLKSFPEQNFTIDYSNPSFRKYLKELQTFKKNKIYWLKFLLLFIFSFIKPVKITRSLVFDAKNKSWILLPNSVFPIISLNNKKIKKFGLAHSFFKNDLYLLKEKRYLHKNECKHLCDLVRDRFGISINENYIIWNGGVFLFDDNSYDFLEQWHQNTLKIFQDSMWKIRDQSSLLVTIFQFNLQDHYTLPKEFNFIADFYNPMIYPLPNAKALFADNDKIIEPKFIHVFHNFGNTEWDVWQRITEILDFST